jgi:hypothetical protein
MPPIEKLLLLALAASGFIRAAGQQGLPAGGETHASRPVFAARSIGPQAVPPGRMRASAAPASPVDLALEKIYNQIDPEKSIFVDDCADWCNDAQFSFEQQLLAAARLENAAAPGQVAAAWKASLPAGLPLDRLILAGIVNRLDLATHDGPGGMWRNAELRFVYANPDRNNFRLILEFVLQPMSDPRPLAQAWLALSTGANDFSARLKQVIAKQKFTAARVRVNRNPSGTGLWNFSQWDFGPGARRPSPMTEQIAVECTVAAGDGCPDRTQYLATWKDALARLTALGRLPDTWHIPCCANTPAATSYDADQFLRIPAGVRDGRVYAARDELAIRQCTFCHGGETGTRFTHVSRTRGRTRSDLSPFLRGARPDTVKPTFAQYQQRDATVLYAVEVPVVMAPGLAPPAGLHPCPDRSGSTCETRYFHDLGRRMLSMAAMLLDLNPADADNRPRQMREALIENYAAHAVH